MDPPEEDPEFTSNARVMGVYNARLQRDIRREFRSGKYKRVRQEPEWHAVGYGTMEEELKYGSSLDPRLVRKAAVKGNDGIEVYVFYGKHLSNMPRFIGNEGAWNPNTTDRIDWNRFKRLMDFWDEYKARGKVWHEDGGSVCSMGDCNCFVNGKHVSGYDIVHVPVIRLASRSSSLWYYDELEHAPVVVHPRRPWMPISYAATRKPTNEELFAEHEFKEHARARHAFKRCVPSQCTYCVDGIPQEGHRDMQRKERLLERSLEKLERCNMFEEDFNAAAS